MKSKNAKQRFKRLLALTLAVVTIFTGAGIPALGGMTAQAAAYSARWSTHYFSDLYKLTLTDPTLKKDKKITFDAYCMKRGTTLTTLNKRALIGSSGCPAGFSAAQTRILKGAWWLGEVEDQRDASISGLDKSARYIMGRAMTWAVTNGGASNANGVKSYIQNSVSASYWNRYGSYVNQILNRAFDGEFDEKVILYYYYLASDPNATWSQPLLIGDFHHEVKVGLDLVKKVKESGVGNNQGAVYGVYERKNSAGTDVNKNFLVMKFPATDKNGHAKIAPTTKLKANHTYYVKEITPPAGMKISSTVYTVTTGKVDGSVSRVNTTNETLSAAVTIRKQDTATKKGLSGAQFTIYEYNASKKSYVKMATTHISDKKNVLTTDGSGSAKSGKLYYTTSNKGKFMIKETKAPAGYTLPANPPTKYVAIGSKDTSLTWTVGNTENYGYVTALKKDDGDTTGITTNIDRSVTFNVYKEQACKTLLGTIRTGPDGKANKSTTTAANYFPSLTGSGKVKVATTTSGTTYYVKEVKCAPGLKLDSTVHAVTVKPNQTYTLTQTDNRYWIKLRVRKVDKETKSPLRNAKFSIYNWNSSDGRYNLMSSANIEANGAGEKNVVTSGADGWAESGKLYYTALNQGKFMIKETESPAGYELSTETWYVELTGKNAMTTVSKESEWEDVALPGKISLQKGAQDYLGNDVSELADYSGIRYEVRALSTNEIIGVITLDSSGYGVSEELTPGSYYIEEKEETIPDTMVKDNFAKTMRVTVKAGETTAYSFRQTGNVTKDGAAAGTGYETNALANLLKSMQIEALKTDDQTKPLAGAEFALYQYSKAAGDYVLVADKIVSDSEGKIEYGTDPLENIAYRVDLTSYSYFSHTMSDHYDAAGGALPSSRIPDNVRSEWGDMNFREGQFIEVTFDPQGALGPQTYTFAARKDISGGDFVNFLCAIVNQCNHKGDYTSYGFDIVTEWGDGLGRPQEYTDDQCWRYNPTGIFTGASGYMTDTAHLLEGDYVIFKGKLYRFYADDDPLDYPKDITPDDRAGWEAAGYPDAFTPAVRPLYYTADNRGRFKLVETKAPDGYKLSKDSPYYFTFDDASVVADEGKTYRGGLYTFGHTFVDEEEDWSWSVTLSKLDDVTKEPLSGAQFTATWKDAAGKDVSKQFTETSRKGVYFLDGGEFPGSVDSLTVTIRETKTPYGYVNADPNKAIKTIEIRKEQAQTTKDVRVELTNQPVTGVINGVKVDAETRHALPQGDASLAGAAYSLYSDAACTKKIAEATTDAEGAFSFGNLAIGTYYIKETKAPKGYRINDQVYKADLKAAYDALADKTGVSEVSVSVTATDNVYKAPVKIVKYSVAKDDAGGVKERNPLAGAGFSLYLLSGLSKPFAADDAEALMNYDFTGETPVSAEIFTGSDGTAVSGALPYGVYVLVETTVPYNHTSGPEEFQN